MDNKLLLRFLLLDYGGKITMELNVTDCTYIRKDINFQFHDSLVVHYFVFALASSY